ncbi:MAG: hypothetical protein E7031_01820 [Akkermansiaceae bacterium]|nr:hypothetical protein [Akkermansiaceae bacterium]
MKNTLLFSILFAPLCLASEPQTPLIYDEDCFVNTELRCPAPDGRAELVYRGIRHRERTEISVAKEIVIIMKDGREITLTPLFCPSSIYHENIIKQPWSPDGKWLVIPTGRFNYAFCPVAALSDTSISGANLKKLSVTEEYTNLLGKEEDGTLITETRQTRFALSGGQWEEDGTFSFRAGLSGYQAPYSATVSEQGVSYKQTGDMIKVYPKR